jgi:hypothetical protein
MLLGDAGFRFKGVPRTDHPLGAIATHLKCIDMEVGTHKIADLNVYLSPNAGSDSDVDLNDWMSKCSTIFSVFS